MRRLALLTLRVAPALALLALAPQADAQVSAPGKSLGSIERLDPKLDAILAPDASMEILAYGFDWSEGPAWFPEEGGYVLFSDVPRNIVYRWKEGEGVGIYLRPSGYTGSEPRGGEPGSNGLLRDPSGRLVLMQHGDRRVARLTTEGFGYETLAGDYEGKKFNSPNDGTYDRAGNLYFTDPPYGLVGNVDDPAKELKHQGVYRLSTDGKVTLLTDEMTRPNGIALSPDEKTLYVANSDPEKSVWMAYPLKEDGTLGPGRVFFDSTKWVPQKKGLPDGLKVDAEGNVFATGPGGVFIFAPDGSHLGTLATGEATGNCCFGDDGSTLYITADMYLARIRLKTKGKGF